MGTRVERLRERVEKPSRSCFIVGRRRPGCVLDWDDLKFVLATTRHGSLSAAAGALGTTQPTVSRRLNGLERSIGVKLFERGPAGLLPTRRGESLVESLAQMVRVEPPKPEPRQPVRLGVHPDMRHSPRIRALLDSLVDELQGRALQPDPGER